VVPRRVSGFSLVELMVSLTLGLLLSATFVTVLDRCRRAMSTTESLAQLQDSTRQATDAVVFDLESAGFFGLQGASSWQLVHDGLALAAGAALRQPDAQHPRAAVNGLPAGSHDCGVNFAVDLEMPVQGTNNSWPAGVDAANCMPTAVAGGVRAGTDSLTVRHASRDTVAPHAGRLQLYSRRLAIHIPAALFADGNAPGPQDTDAEVRDIEVRSYYIANNSVGRPGWPALRVKYLTESAGKAQFRDEEVMPGVEDLQLEFGVRAAGTSDPLQFVTADSPETRAQQVAAVRFWLRIRADSTEGEYQQTRAMRYADVTFLPDAAASKQRRMLIERTVALRNAPLQ
jgi:type IV pilus assembly protein PilW